jgi:Asp-tRNA(Asn)/Glu-tRNA(Gln) amidotransferase A subunit family amidase
MAPHRLNFKEWQALAHEEPERLVDQFLGKLALLAPEIQRAFIAAHLDREPLIEQIKASCADPRQPLAGVPYLLQDMFDLRDLPTRCGAPFADPFEAPLEESSRLAEMIQQRGGFCLAKTVPSEFGWDLRGKNETFGNCPHAEGAHFVCGGGAGASAYAVANGWAPIAFGLDSRGGIRVPAAFHGLFGFRMEHNAYAQEGVFPVVPSIESVGWMTADIEDLRQSFRTFYHRKHGQLNGKPRGFLLNFSLEVANPETKAGLLALIRDLDIDEDLAINKMLRKTFQPIGKAFQTIAKR